MTTVDKNPLETSITWSAGRCFAEPEEQECLWESEIMNHEGHLLPTILDDVEEDEEEQDGRTSWEESEITNEEEVRVSWGFDAGALRALSDDEDELWEFQGSKVQAENDDEWDFSNSLVQQQQEETEDDEWNFKHCKVSKGDCMVVQQQQQQASPENESVSEINTEDDDDEWNFEHCKVSKGDCMVQQQQQQQASPENESVSEKNTEDDDDEWNFEHCKVSKGDGDDAESVTSVTYTGDGSFSIKEAEKATIRDGALEHDLEEARTSFERRQSLPMSQVVITGLPEEDGGNKEEKEGFNDSLSLQNIDKEDDEPLLSPSSWWILSPGLSEADDSIKSPSSAKRKGKKKKKSVRKEKGISSISLPYSVGSIDSISEETESVKSRKSKSKKSKSKDKKKQKDDVDVASIDSSSVASKSKKKKSRSNKSRSLSPTRSRGNRKKVLDEKLDAVNQKLEAAVGVVSTPTKRRKKKVQSSIKECREEKRKSESKLMSTLGKISPL